MTADLAARIIETFTRAIRDEMEAMRQRMGPFEVALTAGRRVGETEPPRYEFRVPEPNDKLAAGTECSLRTEGREYLVSIERVDSDTVLLSAQTSLDLAGNNVVLVIYPWFLYERLLQSLQRLLDSPAEYEIRSALRAFGKAPVTRETVPTGAMPGTLNESQCDAIRLCMASDLAFVWGPPGTGKTTTLAGIVTTLCAMGLRTLVVSTTNAAVDQALAKLDGSGLARMLFDKGEVLRLGQTSAATHGASLREIAARVHGERRERAAALHRSLETRAEQLRRCTDALARIRRGLDPQQTTLFAGAAADALDPSALAGVFPPRRVSFLLGRPPRNQEKTLAARLRRLESVVGAARERVQRVDTHLGLTDRAIVQRALITLTTMTTAYLSPLLESERYDAVVVEEAGMAVLPTLFYCASLAKQKVILVGDPQQLPPIVQSRSNLVARAMGRSIFEVTVPEPHTSEWVALLDTQYRMHPVIGTLVSDLFYQGRLLNGVNAQDRNAQTAREPFPGTPLVLVDTGGAGRCETSDASYSRRNRHSATLCAAYCEQAIAGGVEHVAVITPYVAQSRLIREFLRSSRLDPERVTCHTVHRFQGNECELVILDTVDTAPMKPGVLLTGGTQAANLINVSISRAKAKLIVIADVRYFRQEASDSVLRRVLDALRDRGKVVRG